MTSAYLDVEGQLYTTGAPDAAYTEAEARQRAASHREMKGLVGTEVAAAVAPFQSQVSALSSRVDKTLTDAKAYTDEQLAEFDSFVGVPIFETLAEAEAWEAAHPGKTAYYLDADGTTTPATPSGVAVTWPAQDDDKNLLTWATNPAYKFTVGGQTITSPYAGPSGAGTTIVQAVANSGYTLDGATSKTYTWTAPLGVYETYAADTFDGAAGTVLTDAGWIEQSTNQGPMLLDGSGAARNAATVHPFTSGLYGKDTALAYVPSRVRLTLDYDITGAGPSAPAIYAEAKVRIVSGQYPTAYEYVGVQAKATNSGANASLALTFNPHHAGATTEWNTGLSMPVAVADQRLAKSGTATVEIVGKAVTLRDGAGNTVATATLPAHSGGFSIAKNQRTAVATSNVANIANPKPGILAVKAEAMQ